MSYCIKIYLYYIKKKIIAFSWQEISFPAWCQYPNMVFIQQQNTKFYLQLLRKLVSQFFFLDFAFSKSKYFPVCDFTSKGFCIMQQPKIANNVPRLNRFCLGKSWDYQWITGSNPKLFLFKFKVIECSRAHALQKLINCRKCGMTHFSQPNSIFAKQFQFNMSHLALLPYMFHSIHSTDFSFHV